MVDITFDSSAAREKYSRAGFEVLDEALAGVDDTIDLKARQVRMIGDTLLGLQAITLDESTDQHELEQLMEVALEDAYWLAISAFAYLTNRGMELEEAVSVTGNSANLLRVADCDDMGRNKLLELFGDPVDGIYFKPSEDRLRLEWSEEAAVLIGREIEASRARAAGPYGCPAHQLTVDTNGTKGNMLGVFWRKYVPALLDGAPMPAELINDPELYQLIHTTD